jgi:DNA polymerase III epsilon subunit-like protein
MTIDFEASCLPRHGQSFPIEVGIAGDGMARSWLICPDRRWESWDWTAEAEALHGLSRERIRQEGQPAAVVLAELVAATAGRRMIADSLIDQYWLETLAQAAGAQVPFRIGHVATLFDEQGADEARIAAAVAHADGQGSMRHRAAGDALWLAALVDHLSGHVSGAQPMPVLLAAQ